MAIDPHAPPAAASERPAPAIENEIPSYRAIHPLAVLSLILGLASLLSFAHLAFVAVGVAAIVAGALATRTIRRLPDVLTGRGLAQAGIALGLVFSLSAITVDRVRSFLLTRDIRTFAEQYRQVLDRGDRDGMYYWVLQPVFREGKAPQDAIGLLEQGMGHGAEEFKLRFEAYDKLLDRLKGPGQSIELDAIETQGVDGVVPYGTVRLRLSGPPGSAGAPGEEFALLLLRAHAEHGRHEWFVEDLRYPYQPSTYVPAPQPVDDGHGHAH